MRHLKSLEPRGKKDFFDVTLACDDEHIQPHKAILSEVDFENNISEAFEEPKEEKDSNDVTLVCNDADPASCFWICSSSHVRLTSNKSFTIL